MERHPRRSGKQIEQRPAVEGIVERQPGFELLKVIGKHARETERGGKQSRRFRFQVEARRVGSAGSGPEGLCDHP